MERNNNSIRMKKLFDTYFFYTGYLKKQVVFVKRTPNLFMPKPFFVLGFLFRIKKTIHNVNAFEI
jgi:hypothetical protein